MNRNLSNLSIMRLSNPEEWRARVQAALSYHGRLAPTAEAIGVCIATLKSWLKEDSYLSSLPRFGRGRPAKNKPKKKLPNSKKKARHLALSRLGCSA